MGGVVGWVRSVVEHNLQQQQQQQPNQQLQTSKRHLKKFTPHVHQSPMFNPSGRTQDYVKIYHIA
tara:strand:- start:543 stop:737 length:195 start_codon:yes stop_codon:yes gene_type:complete